MLKLAEITKVVNFIDAKAPFASAESWDNSGLLIGRKGDDIKKITVCLDITPKVIEEAAKNGTQLIVSHHPVIFSPIKRIDEDSPAAMLVRHNIAAICAHTNLDKAKDGVNTALANALELENISFFEDDGAIGVYGDLKKPMDTDELCAHIKEKIDAPYALLVKAKNGESRVSRLAMCSGSGVDFIDEASKCSAQAFLTGEAKHNELLEAAQGDVNLILAGHFATEKVIVKPLAQMLRKEFPDCDVVCADENEPVKMY